VTLTAARAWVRRNLVRSPFDALVSVVFGTASIWLLYRGLRFVLVTGRWDIVRHNLKLLLVGRYPEAHLPRVAVTVVAAAGLVGLLVGLVHRRQVAAGTVEERAVGGSAMRRARGLLRRLWPLALGILLLLGLSDPVGPHLTAAGAVVAAAVGRFVGARLPGRADALVVVASVVAPFALVAYLAGGAGWDGWGGIMLNVFLAVTSIILCFPVGVLAALGRRSSLPIVKGLSTLYIELFRGMPLFVLLLMANIALGFFIPSDLSPGKVVRAIVVFTLFTGAYVAEIVRGGLQSLPPGQEEAAKALGLRPVSTTFLVVLPQALRNVIPAQVGQFISLFKDTTLAGAAMGVFELGQVSEATVAQPGFAGQNLQPEALGFIALLFWIGSYTMSKESQRLERRLGVGSR
jgi:general L-amino acid transport system permease protein